MKNDFQIVCDTLNIPLGTFPFRNESPKKKGMAYSKKVFYRRMYKYPYLLLHLSSDKIKSKDYVKYYDSSTIALIKKFYEKDVDLFKYSFAG